MFAFQLIPVCTFPQNDLGLWPNVLNMEVETQILHIALNKELDGKQTIKLINDQLPPLLLSLLIFFRMLSPYCQGQIKNLDYSKIEKN